MLRRVCRRARSDYDAPAAPIPLHRSTAQLHDIQNRSKIHINEFVRGLKQTPDVIISILEEILVFQYPGFCENHVNAPYSFER